MVAPGPHPVVVPGSVGMWRLLLAGTALSPSSPPVSEATALYNGDGVFVLSCGWVSRCGCVVTGSETRFLCSRDVKWRWAQCSTASYRWHSSETPAWTCTWLPNAFLQLLTRLGQTQHNVLRRPPPAPRVTRLSPREWETPLVSTARHLTQQHRYLRRNYDLCQCCERHLNFKFSNSHKLGCLMLAIPFCFTLFCREQIQYLCQKILILLYSSKCRSVYIDTEYY